MKYISRINELTLEIMELEKEIDYIDEQFKRIDCNYGVRSNMIYAIEGYWSRNYQHVVDMRVLHEIKHFGDRRMELIDRRSEKMNERAELRDEYRRSRKEYFRPMDNVDLVLYITNNGCISGRRL